MANLTVKLRGQVVATLRLERGRTYFAGRAPDADIKMGSERGISRQHLKFYEQEGAWVCESLSKFVRIEKGGEPVDVVDLLSSTIFVVSSYEFYFEPGENRTTPEDVTKSAQSIAVPFLRVMFPNSSDEEIHRLEGHIWTVGRDADCEITVESSHTSRRHCDLNRADDGFYISDLGSSNGTYLNGDRLPAYSATKLQPGDSIDIRGIRLYLEMRDVQFSAKVSDLPLINQIPPSEMETVQVKIPGRTISARPTRNLQSVLIKAGAAIAVFTAGFAIYLRSPTRTTGLPQGALNSEQKAMIETTFKLAQNLYIRGGYSNCVSELEKLHKVVPAFENSKELAGFCETGVRLLQEQERIAAAEAAKKKAEEFVASAIETCKTTLGPNASVAATHECLAEAKSFGGPDHPLITETIAAAEIREKEEKFLNEQKLAELRRQREEEARRTLASIQKVKQEKASGLVKECKSVNAKKEYKKAYLLCQEAIKLDPKNKDAKKFGAHALTSLHRRLKSVFDDSTIEESMGNVAEAKQKWQKIIAEDVENGEYGTKARTRLQKYGDDL